MDLYIYYRVREEDCARLAPLVRAMQAGLAAEGIAGTLKRRPEPKEGRQTWMEVYLSVDDRMASRIEDACAQAGLGAMIDGARHREFFMDVAPCA